MPLQTYYHSVAIKAFTHYITGDLEKFDAEFRAYAEETLHYIGKVRVGK